jgi:DNA-binding SARP family transcriptional activator
MHLYTELIERMWRMIQLELGVESAYQLLMQAYHATGNHEMVRRIYHSCQQVVRQHMGSSVTAETTRIYQQVSSS